MTEYVDLIDEDDNIIGKTTRKEMRAKTLLHKGTAIIIFNSKGKIFIHKRTINKDKFPGYYDIFVGGVVESGEDYDACAKRELEEEIGAKDTKLKFLFKIHYDGEKNKVIYKVYQTTYNGRITFQEDEIESGRFVTLDELKKLIKKEKFSPDGLFLFKKYLEKHHET